MQMRLESRSAQIFPQLGKIRRELEPSFCVFPFRYLGVRSKLLAPRFKEISLKQKNELSLLFGRTLPRSFD